MLICGKKIQPETYAYNPATGSLTVKGAQTLTYADPNHPHAATSAGGSSYQYDANGNQITRIIGADTFNLAYDAENRLVEVKKNNATLAQFVYDGDGKRVKSVIDGETTLFIGNYYERKGSQVTKYYFAGATRIAMRKYTIPQNMTVEYLLGDHLGSASLTTDANGAKVSEIRYKPWGEVRYSWTSGQATAPAYTLPSYTFTGQYSYLDDPSTPSVTEGFGLMFYNARWYDPALGRFTQPDTLIPEQSQGVQAWDRYGYVNNSPLTYIDPSGHCGVKEGKFDDKFDCTADDINAATMKQRLAWFKGFLAVTKREEWFTNIIGILQAFIDEGLGDTNSWVSWVDAGILESIQNGWALFASNETNNNPADMAWMDFFQTPETNEDKLKEKWGAAENLGTRYGLFLAEHYGVEANWREKLFLYVGDKFYRDLLASGQMEETYGDAGAFMGGMFCGPLCAAVGYTSGYEIGEWFGDPRSTVPLTDKAPVYFLAILILEK